jgi:nitrite reductase/ring-hydroxylating ferredoxin subunit
MIVTISGNAFDRVLGSRIVRLYLKHMVQSPFPHLPPIPFRSLDDLGPGEGDVVSVNPYMKVAAFRDEEGEIHAVSAACTHLRCVVEFNSADRTWDCPNDGSRYGLDGRVLSGPATEPLAVRQVGHASSAAV